MCSDFFIADKMNLIIIIIIIILIICLIYICNINNKIQGGSYRILSDFDNDDLAYHFKEIGKEYRPQGDIQEVMKILDNKHNNFLSYVCEYINTTPIEINNNDEKLIVGDVHGSILQLFLPLRQAGIIIQKTINTDNKSTIKEFVITENEKVNKTVIYCGDLFGRASHSLIVPIMIAFLNLKCMHKNIIWVYGNHDIGVLQTYCYNYNDDIKNGLFQPEYNDFTSSNLYISLKRKMRKHVEENPYPCIYYDGKICASHTIMCIEDIKEKKIVSLQRLYRYFGWIVENIKNSRNKNENVLTNLNKLINDKNGQKFTNLLKYHAKEEDYIKTKNYDKYIYNVRMLPINKFNELEIDKQIEFINNLAKYLCIIYGQSFSFVYDLMNLLYWLRPFISKDNINYIHDNQMYKPTDKYFIGHTIHYPLIEADNKEDLYKFDINPIHEKYLKEHKNDLERIKSMNDYNARLAKFNLNIDFIQNIENMKNNKFRNVYFMDIGATFGLGLLTKYGNPLRYNRYNLKDDTSYYEKIREKSIEEFEKINTVEIGFNMCGFAIINNKNNIRSSKLYIF